ncbi:DUF6174 domain-containing protein [Nocardioides sp. R-C-SC26]|uniref:DUF6174 domain-containing protein n=1 Tax=Nocardioides sp. R-C-SC26 TaxID=2870414 RepID=UPI001E511EA7|nr:DUF6174 domain-containing protein [Nocardioides sp. R-C-SC26]
MSKNRSLTAVVVSALLPMALAASILAAPGAQASPPQTGSSAGSANGAPYRVKQFEPTSKDKKALVRAWRKWEGRDLDRYVSVVRRSCFCTPESMQPVRTRVEDGRVTSVTYAGSSDQLREPGNEVESLYRLLRKAYAKAHSVRVTYRAGVPVSIGIDWDEMIADEETYLTVKVRAVP